ncbi:MAG TPA: glycosyltransferase family A protein [Candidatus Binataceae bacterium]|nr:glycosyltransferase family A protein [Candidatus Binataceae bacterium]
MSRLVAITPARDEEKLLPGLISCMAMQRCLPERWIVINDGSVDATGEILDTAARRYHWIEAHHLPRNGSRAAGGESVTMRFLPCEEWHNWDYFLRLDADLTFAEDFIESLLAEFSRDAQLGVAGPILLEPDGTQWREVTVPLFHVRGAAKMFTAECFQAIGGQDGGLGFDTVDELHAMMLGFRSRHFSHIRAYHHRPQGAAGSSWRARLMAGRAAYRSGYSMLFMLARAAAHLFRPPPLFGSVMMLAGYFEGFVRRIPRAASPELVRFVRRQQLRRLLMLETVWR